MTVSTRRFATLLAATCLAGSLAGCAAINAKIADSMGDYIPQWAGGLPPDAPPRPGTAKYDEMMKEREKRRLEPADERDNAGQQPAADANKGAAKQGSSSQAGLDPVH